MNTLMENLQQSLEVRPKFGWIIPTFIDVRRGKYGLEGCIYWHTERNPLEKRICGQDLEQRINRLFDIKKG